MESELDLEVARSLAHACAEGIGWLIGSATLQGHTLAVTGWALITRGTPEATYFLVNGVEFAVVRFPLESPDVAHHYFGILNSAHARFECYVDVRDVPQDRYFRFEFVQGEDLAWARRTAWWMPASQGASDAPSGERMSRVVGSSDPFYFEMGGATLSTGFKNISRSATRSATKILRRFSTGAVELAGCWRISPT
jgi:hypothetical protein